METIKLELQMKADVSNALSTGELVAFNCTQDREIILATENTTWCYYYTDFPWVKINRGSIEDYWNIPIGGSNCLAIFRNFALFYGGYKDRDCFYLVKLGKNHQASIEKQIKPVNLKSIDRICGCGDTIFCLSDQKVYAMSVYEAM